MQDRTALLALASGLIAKAEALPQGHPDRKSLMSEAKDAMRLADASKAIEPSAPKPSKPSSRLN